MTSLMRPEALAATVILVALALGALWAVWLVVSSITAQRTYSNAKLPSLAPVHEGHSSHEESWTEEQSGEGEEKEEYSPFLDEPYTPDDDDEPDAEELFLDEQLSKADRRKVKRANKSFFRKNKRKSSKGDSQEQDILSDDDIII